MGLNVPNSIGNKPLNSSSNPSFIPSGVKEDTKKDTQGSLDGLKREMIPDNLLKETDYYSEILPFRNNIKGKLEDVDNEKLSEIELYQKIINIKIDPDQFEEVGKKEWDEFIDDLRDGQSKEEKDEFEKAMFNFTNMNLYTQAPGDGLYSKDILTTNQGFVGNVIGTTKNIRDLLKSKYNAVSSYTPGMSSGIAKIGQDLDKQASEIKSSNSTSFNVNINGDTFSFNDKKSALKFIYKTKLILSEVNFTYFGFIVSMVGFFIPNFNIGNPLHWLMGIISFGVASIAVGYATVPPVINFKNNAKDLAVRGLGKGVDKLEGVSKALKAPFRYFKGKSGIFNFLLKTITSPFYLGGFLIPEGTNLTPNLTTGKKVLLIDGLSNTPDKTETYETTRREIALDYMKKKWKYDSIRLKQLDYLTVVDWKIFGGQMLSNTNSYWKCLKKIDNGEVIFNRDKGFYSTKKGKEHLKKSLWEQTKRIWNINDDNEIMTEIANEKENQRKAFSKIKEIIYKGLYNGKDEMDVIEIGNKTEFLTRMEGYIDLLPNLSNKQERERNERLNEYIKQIENMENMGVTPESIKRDIMLITDGYFTKYESMELINEEIKIVTDVEYKELLRDIIGELKEDKLVFDNRLKDLLDGSNHSKAEFTNISTGLEYNTNKTKANDLIKARAEEGRFLLENKFELSKEIDVKEFLDIFENNEKKIFEYLYGKNIEHINAQLRELYSDMKGEGGKAPIDYLKSQIYYIVEEIGKGKDYKLISEDIHTINTIAKRYSSQFDLFRENRRELVEKMKIELETVEKETNEKEKSRKLEEYRKKYKFEDKFEEYLENDSSYGEIKNKLRNLEELILGKSFDIKKYKEYKNFIEYFEKEIEIKLLLNDEYSEDFITQELGKLYEHIKSNDLKGKILYLEGELNYIVLEIMKGKSYYEVIKTINHNIDYNKLYGEKIKFLNISKKTLLNKIERELLSINKEEDKIKKENLFEKFKEKYDFDGNIKKIFGKEKEIERIKKLFENLGEKIKEANEKFIEVDKEGKIINNSRTDELIKEAIGDSEKGKRIFGELKRKINSYYRKKGNGEIKKIEFEKLKLIVNLISELKLTLADIEKINFNNPIEYFENLKTPKSSNSSEKREEPKTEPKDSSKTEGTEKPKDSISEKGNKIISLFDKKNSFSYDDLRKKIDQIKNNLSKLEKIENNGNNIELSKEIKNLRTILESFKNINVFIEIHSDSYIENIKLKDLMSKNTLESVYKTMKDIMGYDISIFGKTTKRLEKVETPQKFIEVDKNGELVGKSKKLIEIAGKNYPRSIGELAKLEIEIKKYYQGGKINGEISFSKLGRIVNLVVSGMIEIENNFNFSKEYKFNKGIREDIKEYKGLRRKKVTSKKGEIKVEFTDSDNVTFEELVKEWNKVKDTLKEGKKTPEEIKKINRIKHFIEVSSRMGSFSRGSIDELNEGLLKGIWKEIKDLKKVK